MRRYIITGMVILAELAFKSSAFAEQKLSTAEMEGQKGARVITGGYCSIQNSCGPGVGCRKDPDNQSQCAQDVNTGWKACDGETAPPGVKACVYPNRVTNCLTRYYFTVVGGGCLCSASQAVSVPPMVLATHNTCS